MAQTKSPYFKTSDLRIPPQSLEAERALLGSVMMRPEVVHEIIDIISDRSFYSDRHRLIWLSMLELHQKATPIDLLSLSSKLKEKELLETTGGMTYLTELVQSRAVVRQREILRRDNPEKAADARPYRRVGIHRQPRL